MTDGLIRLHSVRLQFFVPFSTTSFYSAAARRLVTPLLSPWRVLGPKRSTGRVEERSEKQRGRFQGGLFQLPPLSLQLLLMVVAATFRHPLWH